MKNILVLTDFSENSVNAYRYAVQLACQIKANILLVFSTNGKEISLTNQMQYSQMLHSFAKRHACFSRLKANPHHTECLISGDTWVEGIPLLIKVHKPYLVVAGSDLISQFEQKQVTLSLKDFDQSPIIWVPEKASYQPLQNLVFVTDFTDQNPIVVNQVKAFAELFGAQLTCVHFYSKNDRNRLSEIKKQGIEFRSHLIGMNSLLIEEENMIEGLEDFAEQNPADMFILATRDTHLAHHYTQPVYRKTNSCQTTVPLLNLYQEKMKACTGSCEFCQQIDTVEVVIE